MSNDNEQEHNNELKVISKIEIDTELRGLDNKSINQLSNALAEEKSRLDELVIKVDANYEGLIKDLNDLKSEVESLKEGSLGDDEVGGWQAPQFKGVDTEFI